MSGHPPFSTHLWEADLNPSVKWQIQMWVTMWQQSVFSHTILYGKNRQWKMTLQCLDYITSKTATTSTWALKHNQSVSVPQNKHTHTFFYYISGDPSPIYCISCPLIQTWLHNWHDPSTKTRSRPSIAFWTCEVHLLPAARDPTSRGGSWSHKYSETSPHTHTRAHAVDWPVFVTCYIFSWEQTRGFKLAVLRLF